MAQPQQPPPVPLPDAPSARHLRDLALDEFSARAEVARIETSIIFATTWSPRLPDYLDPEPAAAPPPRRRRRTLPA